MADKSIWNQDIAVPICVIEHIDEGVQEKLPPGTKCEGISPSGASYWARTAKISAKNAEGEDTPFFIKVHQNETGKAMASSEFVATRELYDIMPEMVAEPIAWGAYKNEPDTWFYICRYIELSEDVPDKYEFPKLVAEMHKRGVSNKGKFGSANVTFGGRLPQEYPVTNSWERTFTLGLQNAFAQEKNTHGPDEELEKLQEVILAKVVPRLLRPLETEGRTVVPTMVHGDLWDGNASVDLSTGEPRIFDCLTMYAHNEYELAPWCPVRHKMTSEYVDEYIKHYPAADPKEDFRDRIKLYSLRFDLHSSSLYTGNLRFRNECKATMRYLTESYPLGYEGYQEENRRTADSPTKFTRNKAMEANLRAHRWNSHIEKI